MSPDAKKIIEEHREYNNIHFYKLVNEDFVNKELILGFNQKKTIVKGLKNNLKESPYKLLGRKIQLELFYCSEINDLKLHFEKIILSITKNLNYRSLIISEHFLRKTEPEYKFLSKYKKPCDWYYYTENEIDPALINLLYSEKVLLNF